MLSYDRNLGRHPHFGFQVTLGKSPHMTYPGWLFLCDAKKVGSQWNRGHPSDVVILTHYWKTYGISASYQRETNS